MQGDAGSKQHATGKADKVIRGLLSYATTSEWLQLSIVISQRWATDLSPACVKCVTALKVSGASC